MAAPCSACTHQDRDGIDRELAAGDTTTGVAQRHGLSRSAVTRHRDRHLSPALAAVDVLPAAPAGGSVADRVEALVARCEALIGRAEVAGSSSAVLAAMAECRRLLELTAKLSGDLDESPKTLVVNLESSREWQDLQARIMAALEPYPAARLAVAQAVVSR